MKTCLIAASSLTLIACDGTQSALYVYNDGASSGTTIVPLVTTVPRDSVTFYFDTNGVLTNSLDHL